jgi:DNA repair protein RadD
MLEELKRLSITCGMVTGETPKAERAQIIKAYRSGKLRCLVNVAVLTTGFDVPEVDLLALVRNTKSPVLYTQIAGRGMRTAEGKADCLWLDFTDTTMSQGPVNEIKGRGEPKKRDDDQQGAPFRICDECGGENHATALVCKYCGFEFPAPQRKIYGAANGASVLSPNKYGYHEITVNKVSYRAHVGKAGITMMRVDYWGGMRIAASEFICFEHKGFARLKAEKWWASRWAGRFKLPAPETTQQALGMTSFFKEPSTITVKTDGKYPELVSVSFETIAA